MSGLHDFFSRGPGRGLIEGVSRLYREAYEEAARLGRLVGRVTRYSPVSTGPGARVLIEVSPENYFRTGTAPVHRVGDYLASVDPKTLRVVLLRVTRIERQDLLSMIGAEPPVSGYSGDPDPSAAATRTLVEAEPLVEAPRGLKGDPVPASTSIEPQAPVVEPRPEVLERLLSLPERGALLGVLAGPWGPVEGGIPVRLPYRAFLQHVLVVGTTGSGKTTLAKNMVASIYSDSSGPRPVVVALDLNQDYIQLPFPPEGGPPDWASQAYRRVRPPRGVVAVVPVSRDMLENVGGDPCSGYRELYEWYAGHFIEPLSRGRPVIESVAGGTLPRGVVRAGDSRVVIVPYSIDTGASRTEEVLGLIPGLTLLARELLRRTRWRYYKEHGHYPALPLIAAALLGYLESGRRREVPERLVEEMLETVMEYAAGPGPAEGESPVSLDLGGVTLGEAVESLYESLRKLVPSDKTVEALYRRLAGLLEGGLVDVMVACGRTARVLGEPGWSDIIGLAAELGYPVVIDLKPASESGMGGYEGPRTVAYRMLQKLISWKQAAYARRERTRPVLVLIDEAHQFFPQERGPREEQEANRQVASMISRVARLGRARGVGLMFATHSPRDLHDIILQLANTKIILRTERGQLERLQLPGDLAASVPRMPDRMMAVLGHSYREGYVLAVTPPPVVRHYDVSATL